MDETVGAVDVVICMLYLLVVVCGYGVGLRCDDMDGGEMKLGKAPQHGFCDGPAGMKVWRPCCFPQSPRTKLALELVS